MKYDGCKLVQYVCVHSIIIAFSSLAPTLADADDMVVMVTSFLCLALVVVDVNLATACKDDDKDGCKEG